MTTETESADLLSRTETAIAALPEIDVTPDMCCDLIDKLDGMAKRIREAKAQLEAFLITWLPDHGGELVIGDVKHFVTMKKKDKCRNIPKAVTALYEATGGDFDAFCDVLSSNAIKYGAAKKVLGAGYYDHFETIVETDIDHKPVKVLASVNEKFIR